MLFFDTSVVSQVADSDIPVNGLWTFLPIGYLLSIIVETPVLVVGLPKKVTLRQRLLCGIWLTACTYPIVVLVMPLLFETWQRWQYLLVAETFAPVAECALFWLAFRGNRSFDRWDWLESLIAITIANLASFGIGEILNYYGWFGLL